MKSCSDASVCGSQPLCSASEQLSVSSVQTWHVHATADNQPEEQYCGCAHKNQTRRGAFGDARLHLRRRARPGP